MLRHSIILPLIFFLSSTAHSQPSWRIDHLGVDQGLSEGNVYVIHQDRKGFIWIGTHGGLNRYDGYGFRVFQYDPVNASTLGDNAIFFLKEDSASGKFWIGGSSCLNEFDPETFTNTRYRYPKKQLEFADGVFVNGHEMLLACEHDVLLFNTRTKQFSEIPVYDENNTPVSISRVENAAADRVGNFMIMSRTGVYFYDSVTRTCRRKTASSPDFSYFNDHEVFNVTHDSRGRYWIATNKKGLIRLDPSARSVKTISLPAPFMNESLRFDVVTEDRFGNIWAGSSSGIFQINPSTSEAKYLSIETGTTRRMGAPEVNVITEGKNGLMWIGTVGAGVRKMIPVNTGFRHFALSQTHVDDNTGTYVMAVHQLGHDIWFANIWDQIGKIDMLTGRTTLVKKPILPDNYGWYSEGAIIHSENDVLTMLNGESRFDIRSEAGRVSMRSQPSPGLSYVYNTKNKKTWFMVKSAVANTFQRNDTIFGNQFFFDAKEDSKGILWIGSSRGLIRFDPKSASFTHFQHDYNNSNSISSDFVYKLQITNDDAAIWMAAYHGGLSSYEIESGTFRHYNKEDGLSDNTVYSIEKDIHGNLWFSTNAGISSYNVQTKNFRNYSVADGLLNHEFNRRASFMNEAGWIFFGGIYGIDYFHPDSIAKDHTDPILAFTNFRILDKDFIPDLADRIPTITLQPDDRQVTVEFASMDYKDQQKIQYAFRINQNRWIKVGNQHVLSFSDLATGDHQLSIRSTNNEGIWLDNEIECLITVQPFWWQTWWARVAGALFALAMIIAGIRFYYHRKMEKQKVALERQQAVEKERTRIATDMHDDLGADLSRIKFLTETIGIKRQKQQAIEEEINSIRNYTFDMMDKMGEIVWALNERNDTLSDLLGYTRSYIVEYLSQNGIQADVKTPEQIPDVFVTGDFRRNVYLTIKEALHNIVKHSRADRADIAIDVTGHLSVRIHDNGKGFDQSNVRPFSNGISNMKKRVAALGGQMEIKNTQGSTVLLNIPLP